MYKLYKLAVSFSFHMTSHTFTRLKIALLVLLGLFTNGTRQSALLVPPWIDISTTQTDTVRRYFLSYIRVFSPFLKEEEKYVFEVVSFAA